MDKKKFSLKDIPGWAVMLALFGVLYLTGLHTEVIGQIQRVLLATGIKNADVPNEIPLEVTEKTAVAGTLEMAGTGFTMMTLDGNTVNFESLKGKVVFMNSWAFRPHMVGTRLPRCS